MFDRLLLAYVNLFSILERKKILFIIGIMFEKYKDTGIEIKYMIKMPAGGNLQTDCG